MYGKVRDDNFQVTFNESMDGAIEIISALYEKYHMRCISYKDDDFLLPNNVKNYSNNLFINRYTIALSYFFQKTR